jgi:hypothetical protein
LAAYDAAAVVELIPAGCCCVVCADVEALLLCEGGGHGVSAAEVTEGRLLGQNATLWTLLLLLLVLS